jgi:NAD(P)-dependent dehydrogenase (short-subunit alcohol dehydrogenase family)
MTKRVLVIGGYGHFGSVIARRLSREENLTVIVAGRSEAKARALAEALGTEWAFIDIDKDVDAGLEPIRPDITIHTSGPFQGQGYQVARACIRHGCHYIDLADGRDFVANVTCLDEAARGNRVLVTSGASSVPALTSAIIDEYSTEFLALDRVSYGIATAQRNNRGPATARAVLGCAGVPFETLIRGKMESVYGWQDLHWRKFAGLGWRTLGNCDVPDLALFPERYPDLKTIRFYAGLELPVVHVTLWLLSWLVRFRLIGNLASISPFLLALSRPFDLFGTDDSGFFMELDGIGADGDRRRLRFDLVARSGDGPFIPCAPAIAVALQLAGGKIEKRGATACVGLVNLGALLKELEPLDIAWHVSLVPEPAPTQTSPAHRP